MLLVISKEWFLLTVSHCLPSLLHNHSQRFKRVNTYIQFMEPFELNGYRYKVWVFSILFSGMLCPVAFPPSINEIVGSAVAFWSLLVFGQCSLWSEVPKMAPVFERPTEQGVEMVFDLPPGRSWALQCKSLWATEWMSELGVFLQLSLKMIAAPATYCSPKQRVQLSCPQIPVS